MLQVYLVGASREAKTVRAYAQRLSASGFVHFTHAWWDTDPESWSGHDDRYTRDEQAGIATDCAEGIAAAECVWVLWPGRPSIGAYVELGMALERKRVLKRPHIILTGRNPSASIFTGLVDVRDVVHEIGCMEVIKFASEKARAA